MVALLVMGSAILLISCKQEVVVASVDEETLVTQRSDSLVLIMSERGIRKYRFETPLLERYELAKKPYMEFKKGVDIITYEDSTMDVASTLIADYAIFYETKKLWEAKGNVVAKKVDGQTLMTEQLFWDQITKKIYSDVESTVIDGDNVIVGVGFESDEEFDDYLFREPKGKVLFDAEPQPTSVSDSVVVN